jgi:Ca-activated chloride channel family protein
MKKMLLGFVLVFATLFTNSIASDNPRAVIIFDASGSMWGQINGVTKIEIARDALKNVVKEWNPSVELGLTVYGHRSKGDCNDIETIIPVGKIDKNRVIKTVMSIKPKGKTPISRSLRKVADEIKYTEEKATIILISDGKETCDPDPCGTAKELEAQGIDFVTHVIGFNVDKKTDKQLECIAHATGGEYFSAKNATALNKAMKVIAKKVEKQKSVVTNMILVPVIRYDMSPNGLNLSNVQLEVSQDGQTIYSGRDEAPKVDAKVANVHLKAIYNRVSIAQTVEKDFTLASKEKNVVTLLVKSGQVIIDTAEEQGGPKVKSSVHIYPVIDGEPKRSDEMAWCVPTKTEACERVLPIGDFFIEASYNDMKVQKRFTLNNKEKKSIHLYFKQTGKAEISASEKEGGKWVEAFHDIYTVEDGKASDRVINCWSKKKEECLKQIPVGKYILKSNYNKFKTETAFEIKAGEVTKLNIVFGQTGKAEISASETEGGKWIAAYHNILEDDDGKAGDLVARANSQKKSAGKAQIPVGKYILKSSYKSFKKETPLEIKAGKTTKVHITFGQFFIFAKCSDMNAKINYEIYASSGQLVYEKKIACSDALKVTLDNGDYSVEAKVGNDIKEVKFTVGGSSSKLIIDMTDIKKEPTKEELIKADRQETPVVEEVKNKTAVSKEKEQKSEKITIGNKQIEIRGISKEDADKIKELGAILGAFGGMVQGLNSEEQKNQKEKQSAENVKADKEFDDMSQELDMFTK